MKKSYVQNLSLGVAAVFFASASFAGELIVDFSQEDGVIRALHGMNSGPVCYRGVVDLSKFHNQLDIPLTRLHDVPWANYEACDLSMIFLDERDDPGEADNYNFSPTDDYIATLVENKTPILFRLGESIEHTPRKYRVNPPKDFHKWAEICCGIIRHYNEGWAGGFEHKILYWEIWNEPDNKPWCWTGTDEQFMKLYEVAAKAIKSRWPDLKVGGPALANAGRIKNGKFVPSAYALRFLGHCQANQVPLDFFSWHRYTKDPSEYALLVRGVRKMLDDHGFTETESHLNEWNYLPRGDWTSLRKGGQGLPRQQWLADMGGPEGAAFDAWVLMALQDERIDMANFFTSDIQMLGLFTDSGVPKKNFHAFKAFRALLDTPQRVKTPPCEKGQVAVCAGLDANQGQASILLSNFDAEDASIDLVPCNLPWKEPTRFEVFLVDAENDFELIRQGILNENEHLSLTELKTPSVVLLKLKKSSAPKKTTGME